MSAISLKSITGITSITTPAGVDNQLTLHTNNTTERFRIDSDGRLMVGNTAASSFNASVNQFVLGNGVGNQGMMVYTGASHAGSLIFNDVADGTFQGGLSYKHGSGANDNSLKFYANAGERLRITSDGSILIDTTVTTEASADGNDLIIGSTSDTQKGISIVGSTTNGVGNIFFTDGASYKNQGIIQYRHADDSMRFTTAQYERLRITGAGKVGIGTTGSEYALSIREADNNNKFLMLQKNSGQELLQIREDGNNHIIFDGSHASGELHFYTAGNERLRIDSSGQLIMTNATTHTFADFSTTNNNTRGLIKLDGKDSSGNAVSLRMGGFGDTNRGEIFTQSNHGLGFATNNAATQMMLDTGGDLLLGATSFSGFGASDKRFLINGSSNARFEFGVGGNQIGGLYADADKVVLYTSNNDYLSFQTIGNEKLKIDNTALYVKSGFPLAFLASSGPTPNIKSGGTNNQDLLFTSGSGNPERLRITSDGFVGINENSPSRHLHVNSGSSDIVALFESSDTSAQIQIKDANGTCAIECLNDFRFENSSAQLVIFKSDKDVQIMDGNLVVANGHGIDFSATADGTGSNQAEILDDYEEGDFLFTPTGSNGGSISMGYRVGHYTRIGNIVHVTGDIRFTGSWSGTDGDFRIDIPFKSEETGGAVGGGIVYEWNLTSSVYESIMIKVDNNENIARFTIHDGSNNNTSQLQTNYLGNNRYLKFAFTYHAD